MSILSAKLSSSFTFEELTGNFVSLIGSKQLVPTGTNTRNAAGFFGGTTTFQFGTTDMDYAAIADDPGPTGIRFDRDFIITCLFFVPSGASYSGGAFLLTKGKWLTRVEFLLGFANRSLSVIIGTGLDDDAYEAGPAFGNGQLQEDAWNWVFVQHDVSEKRLDLYHGNLTTGQLEKKTKVYSTTIGRGIESFRVNGISDGHANTGNIEGVRIQDLHYADNVPWTETEINALFDAKRILRYPFDEYDVAGEPRVLTPGNQIAAPGHNERTIGRNWAALGNATFTTRKIYRVSHPTIGAQFTWQNLVASASGDDFITPSNQGNITILGASFYQTGYAATVHMTFDTGSATKVMAYKDRAKNDPIESHVFYPNLDIVVSTHYQIANGAKKVPGVMPAGESGEGVADGGSISFLDNIGGGDFVINVGDTFVPQLIEGRRFGDLDVVNKSVVFRADSLGAADGTLLMKCALAAPWDMYNISIPGEPFSINAIAGNDDGRTQLIKDCKRLVVKLGTNDLRNNNRTAAQLLTDVGINLSRWCDPDTSNVQSIWFGIPIPITEAGAPDQSALTTQRGIYNGNIRSFLDSSDWGVLTGRPTQVFYWDETEFVSFSPRSSGDGLPLNVFISDDAKIFEDDETINNNLWNTEDPAPAGKIVVSGTTVTEGVHTTEAENILARPIQQPQYNAFMEFPLPIAEPVFDPAPGTFFSTPQSIEILNDAPNSEVRYTTNGSTPNATTGTVYSVPISIAVTTTIKAVTYDVTDNSIISDVVTGVFTITLPTAAMPAPSPAAGAFDTPPSVTLTSATSGATIRYTLDGSTPSDSVGTIYSGPVPIPNTLTLKAIAYKAGHINSAVRTAAYIVNIQLTNDDLHLTNGAALRVTSVDYTGGLLPVQLAIEYRKVGDEEYIRSDFGTLPFQTDPLDRGFTYEAHIVVVGADDPPTTESVVLGEDEEFAVPLVDSLNGGDITASFTEEGILFTQENEPTDGVEPYFYRYRITDPSGKFYDNYFEFTDSEYQLDLNLLEGLYTINFYVYDIESGRDTLPTQKLTYLNEFEDVAVQHFKTISQHVIAGQEFSIQVDSLIGQDYVADGTEVEIHYLAPGVVAEQIITGTYEGGNVSAIVEIPEGVEGIIDIIDIVFP